MSGAGLSISAGQLRWCTGRINRTFVRLGSLKPNLLRIWFTLGVVFGAIAMVLSVVLLSIIIVNTLRQQHVEQQVIMPVVSCTEIM